jgi:protein tyrosine phosphatase (PTP) superfamily phosphohydrolase (DUF442 family)
MSLDELAGPALDCCRSGTDGTGGVSLETLHDRRMGTGDLLGSLLH